jgi:hypothetical protein
MHLHYAAIDIDTQWPPAHTGANLFTELFSCRCSADDAAWSVVEQKQGDPLEALVKRLTR